MGKKRKITKNNNSQNPKQNMNRNKQKPRWFWYENHVYRRILPCNVTENTFCFLSESLIPVFFWIRFIYYSPNHFLYSISSTLKMCLWEFKLLFDTALGAFFWVILNLITGSHEPSSYAVSNLLTTHFLQDWMGPIPLGFLTQKVNNSLFHP